MWHKSAKLEFISDEAITISLSRDCDRRLRYKFNAMFNCLSRPNVGKNRDGVFSSAMDAFSSALEIFIITGADASKFNCGTLNLRTVLVALLFLAFSIRRSSRNDISCN